jgi:hypothetical protein
MPSNGPLRPAPSPLFLRAPVEWSGSESPSAMAPRPRLVVPVADPAGLAEILCIEHERVVARDNTVTYGSLRLQLPPSRARAHYVKARVRVHEYPDGALAVFHGPCLLARYDAAGQALAEGALKLAA